MARASRIVDHMDPVSIVSALAPLARMMPAPDTLFVNVGWGGVTLPQIMFWLLADR